MEEKEMAKKDKEAMKRKKEETKEEMKKQAEEQIRAKLDEKKRIEDLKKEEQKNKKRKAEEIRVARIENKIGKLSAGGRCSTCHQKVDSTEITTCVLCHSMYHTKCVDSCSSTVICKVCLKL